MNAAIDDGMPRPVALANATSDRNASGSTGGYSVATTPTAAERAAGSKPVWFGGGRLVVLLVSGRRLLLE